MERKCPSPHHHRFRLPHREKRNETAIYELSSSLLHARYGIYNDRNVETTATTGLARKERTGQGLERAGGRRYAKEYVHANLALSLSISPSLRISTAATTTQTSHLKLIRPKSHEEMNGAETRGQESETEKGEKPKESKQASGKRSSLYPSTRRGRGRSSVLLVVVPKEGKEDAIPQPPFLFLLSLNSVYCAPVLV